MDIQRLILASTSPFRRGLLAQAGMAFDPCSPECDEYEIHSDDPRTLAQKRAEAKALSVSKKQGHCLVLGADQVLGFGNRALDKVKSVEEARTRLGELQGKEHVLHSAYALAVGEKILVSKCIDALMPMRPLTADDIEQYLRAGEWKGSVGCYQFENRGGQLFEPVSIDTSVIVGLPIVHLAADLRQLGIDLLRQPAGPWSLR